MMSNYGYNKKNQSLSYLNHIVSTDKTKIMTFIGKHLVRSKIEIDGSILEQVKQFNYLGCELSLDGEPDFDKKKQISRNFQFHVTVHHTMINENTSLMQLLSIYFT